MPLGILRVTRSFVAYPKTMDMLKSVMGSDPLSSVNDHGDVLLTYDHPQFVDSNGSNGEHTLIVRVDRADPKGTQIVGFRYSDGYNRTEVYL